MKAPSLERAGAYYSARPGTPLSQREAEILALVALGNTGKQVGRALGISRQTVKNHMTNIFNRLEARNAPHAVYLYFVEGKGKAEEPGCHSSPSPTA